LKAHFKLFLQKPHSIFRDFKGGVLAYEFNRSKKESKDNGSCGSGDIRDSAVHVASVGYPGAVELYWFGSLEFGGHCYRRCPGYLAAG
jgi:hypothetical protein